MTISNEMLSWFGVTKVHRLKHRHRSYIIFLKQKLVLNLTCVLRNVPISVYIYVSVLYKIRPFINVSPRLSNSINWSHLSYSNVVHEPSLFNKNNELKKNMKSLLKKCNTYVYVFIVQCQRLIKY